ncbi:hydroxymethylbilane synthase [Actinobacteria bacterium YIM 96077]|uniref:Porphobilinogen deaminase n=2 Tax=Phytoactinopolyspora halophila TaxID=1981511 RepID=A0A329QLD8_9ACTN|nr:hydroxymethylbilane synthase [Actinobacteria bacterium YIM 96077]RAW13150.1 hydroxymethylbilane synthase [Phytoactinopolyspora halophila]
MAQATSVADAFTAATGRDVELVEITTKGDVSSEPLATMGGTGVFVSALREAVLDGRVDVAVHSLKDLPTASPDGLVLAAVPERADPRDALCARDGLGLAQLPPGSTVGTGSPRRAAQLRALGLDLEVVEIRGNVDTRLRKVTDGQLDAVVLAYAGLGRLGRTEAVTEILDPLQLVPAPGQGALAVECRAADGELTSVMSVLDDPGTRPAVVAERALLAELEAGCSAPVGAYAVTAEGETPEEDELYIRGVVISGDGSMSIRKSATGSVTEAERLGRELAREMLEDGAGAVVGAEKLVPKKENVS